ncbi:helix-turn-helix transcriptional regulator [Longispora sp. NPDC051575]|uniref:helix-turn-helix transcriptional regulator n=1 Tax=Longispora sp. NPDC051575 TaxID=3154943 RepID=UPI003425480F
MVTRPAAERAALARIRALSATRAPLPDLFGQLNDILAGVVGFDAGCWHGTDPATGFLTSTVAEHLDPARFERAAYLELWTPEPLTFARLRQSGRPADSLHRVTGGRPGTSGRFRELLAADGFGDELRIVFDTPTGRWGAAAFMRAAGRGPFTAPELGLVERLSPHIGALLGRSYRPVPGGPDTGAPEPAVAVLGPTGRLVSADPRAEALIARLAEALPAASGVPTGFIVVAEHARGAAATGRAGVPSRSRIRGSDGRWLTLHASLLDGRPDGHVAILVTPASPAEALPVALMSYGLTGREQEVALHVARGRTTRDIAARLTLSPLTVQDHLKAIFTKTGVRSRRELLALLMAGALADARP